MKIPPFLLAAFLFLPTPAFAQEAPVSLGMHHMSVTAEKAREDTPQSPAPVATVTETPAPTALKPEDALKKIETLADWPYYTDILTLHNDTALEKIMHSVDIDPGGVPPKGLLYIAKALSDRKRYEEAAFYFYAGQLRATFDMARFPPYSPAGKKATSDKRTEDQRGGVPESAPMLVNPHDSISLLALTIGAPVAKWAMADPKRLDAVMDKVRNWDLATPYAYLPDYDISHAAPFATWPGLLTKTRNDYFTRVRQISMGLTSVRPIEPTPSFTRP